MFSEGLGYVVAYGEDTYDVFDELVEYNRSLNKTDGMRGTVINGDKNRDGDELYVVMEVAEE